MHQAITLFLLLIFTFTSSYSVFSETTPQSSSEYNFMIISDIHLGAITVMNTEPSKPSSSNDLDLESYKMLMNQINQILISNTIPTQQILVLGDLVDHISSSPIGNVDWRMTQLSNTFSTLLESEKMTGIPFAYVPGNNDSLAGNYKPFYTQDTAMHSPKDIAINTGWQGFLTQQTTCNADNSTYPCMLDENVNGYYVESLTPNLQIIALNTVLFSNRNECTDLCKDEINWLVQQLQSAYQRGVSVLIAAHIPPGIDMYSGRLSWNEPAHNMFFEAVAPWSENIVAVFVGHSHMEESQFIQFKDQTPIPVIYTAGLSTSHGNSPSFKFVQLSMDEQSKKWSLKNYQTYHYINHAFQFFYDAKRAYCNNDNDVLLTQCFAQFISDSRLSELQAIINHYFTAGNPNYQTAQKDTNAEDLVTHWS